MEEDTPSSRTPSRVRRSFLERLFSAQSLKLQPEDVVPVAVIALGRYLSEEQPDEQHPDVYSYDVTLTDGVWRAKCFLHRSLNHLVHRNILRTGADVSITQCSFVYNERRLGHGYVRIEEVKCGSKSSGVLRGVRDVQGLPLLLKHGMEIMALRTDVPLQVTRKHYLALWNNDDPEGTAWTPHAPAADAVLDVSKISLVSDLESYGTIRWRPLPLLVRIIHKSRLRYYGKFGLTIEFPYQAYFEVADQSGTMSLVLWNELCPEWYHRLNVGAVLYLQNYSLKQSYPNRTRPHMDHHRMRSFHSVEICLNARNPVSLVTVVPPKSVLPQWGLPGVAYQFTPRSELENLANKSSCDLIGLVTFVGRVERVRCKANKGAERYCTYRWVHAVDGTSNHPFILEMFSSSQPDIFNQISPMTYLVCTQMRVCQVDGSPPYLTSSCETEMLITGHHKGRPYVSEPAVKSFLQWTKTLKDSVVLQKTVVGGQYCFPPAPRTFTQSAADGSTPLIPLVAAADLKKELESLQYRERKRIAIQGQIMAVQYLKYPQSTGRDNQQVPDGSADAVPDTHTDHSTETLTTGETSADGDRLSWESGVWPKLRQEVSEHVRDGGLYPDSVAQRFTFDEKERLLQWSTLQPSQWAPEQSTDAVPAAFRPGYYRTTVLGINNQMAIDAAFFPVAWSGDPRAVGLPQEPHGNTMLSCLSSGFLCPLSDSMRHSDGTLPEPEEVLATAAELEDTHFVCVLDLCNLGGDEVEILINKVYRVSDISLV
ncbi:RPA-related protein RADX [Diretmus argenteus]